jgi:hypothetical protein
MMKKIFRLFAAVNFLVLTCFAQTIKAQLSEVERQERCQNNRNRVAELETQLRVIDADLSASMTKKEMADAREEMVFVKSMRNKMQRTEAEKDKYEIISFHYNFKHDECYAAMHKISKVQPYKRCIDELGRIIAVKIDKAASLDRTAIVAKKQQTTQQLAAHRNNLVALDCDDKASGVCRLAGSWIQDTPGIGSTTWEIKSDGTADERGIGYAKGKASLRGNVLHIDWQTSTGYSGYYEWTLDENCRSVKGTLVFKTGRTDTLNSTVKKS